MITGANITRILPVRNQDAVLLYGVSRHLDGHQPWSEVDWAALGHLDSDFWRDSWWCSHYLHKYTRESQQRFEKKQWKNFPFLVLTFMEIWIEDLHGTNGKWSQYSLWGTRLKNGQLKKPFMKKIIIEVFENMTQQLNTIVLWLTDQTYSGPRACTSRLTQDWRTHATSISWRHKGDTISVDPIIMLSGCSWWQVVSLLQQNCRKCDLKNSWN